MEKTPIYFMPGLAASPKIFENLAFDLDRYTLHYLNWIAPQSSEEDIGSYACRLSAKIKEKNPVLIGVSFGGIIVIKFSCVLSIHTPHYFSTSTFMCLM